MSSAPPVPVVLVGCGAVSQLFYAPSLRALERTGELRVQSLVDPAENARAKLSPTFPKAQAVADLAEARTGADALAIIASPPRFHLRHAEAAFARGWHVLCEKPMAANGAECDEMIAAAERTDRKLAIGHYKRFYPSSQQLKVLCAPDGPLGRLRHVSIFEGGPFGWPAASPSFFRRNETPGGVLLDIGVHVFDLLLWWLGEPTAFSHADDAMGGLETNAVTELAFPSGATARVQLSRDWKTPQRYTFEFERGRAAWTVNDANGLSVTLDGLPFVFDSRLQDDRGALARSNPQSFITQLQQVATAIRTDTAVLIDGAAGARAVRLIEACYARKQLLPQPWLTSHEAAVAARLAAASTIPA